MAIPTNIRTLLSGTVVEWARIEFKTTWNPGASLKTITAFANDLDNWGGGYIVIGVKEANGIPVKPYEGVPLNKVDAWQKDVFEKCRMIRPGYTPIIGIDKLEGKTFIIIWCPGGDARPYSAPKTMARNDKERCYYIRKGSVTAVPNDDEVKELFALANKTPFDDRVNHFAELSDINYALIKSYLKEIGSSLYAVADDMAFVDLCKDMNLLSVLPEYVKPKNVALMFFNSEPEKFFPYAQIDVVQFPEGEGGNKIIEQTFKGPLHEQLRAALRYIRNTVITEQVVKHPDRAEADRFFNFPYAAIEEALSNAVYHKAYDEREPIEVRVERDMIEIISHPGPDRSVTMEGLRTFKVRSRRYRNRRIGEFLKELRLTEGRNTGFKKILDALRKNGSPLPEFETDEYHDYFITRLFVRKGFYDYLKENEVPEDDTDTVVSDAAEDRNVVVNLVEDGSDIENVVVNPTEDGNDIENVVVNPTEDENDIENVVVNPTEDGNDIENVVVKPLEDGNNIDNVLEAFPETAQTFLSGYSAKKRESATALLKSIMYEKNMTISQMAMEAGITTRTVQRYLQEFQKVGILKHIGSDKNGEWLLVRD